MPWELAKCGAEVVWNSSWPSIISLSACSLIVPYGTVVLFLVCFPAHSTLHHSRHVWDAIGRDVMAERAFSVLVSTASTHEVLA